MVTYDDFDGVYFSIQAIRMFHKEIIDDIEFIVIDNNPTEAHGSAVKGFTGWITDCPIKYIPFTEYKSTAIRSKIFEHANTPYVLVMDCHVFFEPNSLKKLIEYFDQGKDGGNLLQGPMIYDDLKNFSTHFDLVWRAQMWGTWGTDERAKDVNAEPFEIPAQGLGCFTCRKDSWLGFNPNFRGFGGEEGYIHEKYRKAGKKTLCLPFLRWMHRFGRPGGVKYPLLMELKVKNYVLGFNEVGLDTKPIYDHFKEFAGQENLDKWFTEAGDGLFFKKQKPIQELKNETSPEVLLVKTNTMYEIFKNKPSSIHNIIPKEFFTKYDSYDYVWSGNCFEWYYAISKVIQPKSFLEIGVRYGFSFLPTLIGSDKLEYALGWDLETYGNNTIAKSNIGEYYKGNCKWEVLHKDSQLEKELPQFFDLVSIDGCHDYSCKIHDLKLCIGKCNYVILDDYDYHSEVRRAVDDFLKQHADAVEWNEYIKTFRGSQLIKFKNAL